MTTVTNRDIFLPQKRRAVTEIFLDIMKITALGPIPPTKLMYACNLSWKPLQKYVGHLINIGYIEELPLRRANRYAITATEKGKSFVNAMGKFEQDITFATVLPADYNVRP